MKRSSIREILKLTQNPEIISFAGGLPAPELFPLERISEAAQTVLKERGAQSLQYSVSEGLPELRDWIAQRMSNAHLQVKRENVLIVSGAQQAIDLIGRVLLDNGDRVVVENPTYLGMLVGWMPYHLRHMTIPTDADGMRVDLLEPLLRKNPKLLYLVPNFQNPQGVTLSFERRRTLAWLLTDYDIPVLEDNPYGDLRYDGKDIPSLLELDAQHVGTTAVAGHVIYVGSFSKILAPGFRVGWIVAPPLLLDKLLEAKQAADLHTGAFVQSIICEVARDGFFDQQIPRLRQVYRERRDVMLAALERHFPHEVKWSKPDGGLFLMVTLPEHVNAAELLREAIEHKVAFVPGDDFHVGESGRNTFRLNFSNMSPEKIEEGIERLGVLLKKAIVREMV
jgi:2-aminoadipate transaminase